MANCSVVNLLSIPKCLIPLAEPCTSPPGLHNFQMWSSLSHLLWSSGIYAAQLLLQDGHPWTELPFTQAAIFLAPGEQRAQTF